MTRSRDDFRHWAFDRMRSIGSIPVCGRFIVPTPDLLYYRSQVFYRKKGLVQEKCCYNYVRRILACICDVHCWLKFWWSLQATYRLRSWYTCRLIPDCTGTPSRQSRKHLVNCIFGDGFKFSRHDFIFPIIFQSII